MIRIKPKPEFKDEKAFSSDMVYVETDRGHIIDDIASIQISLQPDQIIYANITVPVDIRGVSLFSALNNEKTLRGDLKKLGYDLVRIKNNER